MVAAMVGELDTSESYRLELGLAGLAVLDDLELDAVEVGHVDIDKRQLDRVVQRLLHRLLAVADTRREATRWIRDRLAALDFDEGVFLDGSDSSCMWHGGSWQIMPAHAKNITNTIGVAFG